MYESFGLIGIQLSEKYKDVPSTHALFNRAWWKRRSTEYGVGVRSAEYGVLRTLISLKTCRRSVYSCNYTCNFRQDCLVAICNVNTPRL
jgi:hypothetical protein